jgi:Mn-containing catalase
VGEEDAGRKDMSMDIVTEEPSQFEVIGSIVAMLNKGIKPQRARRFSRARGGDRRTAPAG